MNRFAGKLREEGRNTRSIWARMVGFFGELPACLMAGEVKDPGVTMQPAISMRLAEMQPFSEHQCVRLAVERPDAGLAKGALGAVVHAYPGGTTYEVEFPDATPGHEVLTLNAGMILADESA